MVFSGRYCEVVWLRQEKPSDHLLMHQESCRERCKKMSKRTKQPETLFDWKSVLVLVAKLKPTKIQ